MAWGMIRAGYTLYGQLVTFAGSLQSALHVCSSVVGLLFSYNYWCVKIATGPERSAAFSSAATWLIPPIEQSAAASVIVRQPVSFCGRQCEAPVHGQESTAPVTSTYW